MPATVHLIASALKKPLSIRLRWLLFSAVAVALLLTALFAAAGWYYSEVLRDGALTVDHAPDPFDLEVAAVEDGRITLRPMADASRDDAWTKDGIWGLKWHDGYVQVGNIVRLTEQEVVRPLVPGSERPNVGVQVRLDSFVFDGDPETAHGIPFQAVTYSSELGQFPAWFVPGAGSTWVIFVHGWGANRRCRPSAIMGHVRGVENPRV